MQRNDPGNPILPLLTLAGVYLAWDYTMAGGQQVARVIALYQWLHATTQVTPQTMTVAPGGLSALTQLAILIGLFFIGAIVMMAMGKRTVNQSAAPRAETERKPKRLVAVQHRSVIGRGKMRKVSL